MEETELGFDVEAGVPLLNEEEEEEEDADYEDDVAVESLDYDSIHNVVHEQLLTKQHRHSHRHLYGSELLYYPQSTVNFIVPVCYPLVLFASGSNAKVYRNAGIRGSHLPSGRLQF